MKAIRNNYVIHTSFLITIFLLVISCSNSSDPEIPIQEPRFRVVLYDGLTDLNTVEILSALEDNYDRILAALNVDNMPEVSVEIWNDNENFMEAMEVRLGTRYIGASGYVTSNSNIHMLMTDGAPVAAVHEFAHLVSMQVNPTIPNNPRWLWEATAVYLAGEFVHPDNFNYFVNDHYPTISDLNAGFNMYLNTIYSVGYVLTEYIVDRWGNEGLIHLIENNGRIYDTFGITTEEFEAGWYLFMEREY